MMLKVQNKIIDGLLVCILTLGLGGCATSSVATHKANHEPISTKVAKQSNHQKATNKASEESINNQVPIKETATNTKLTTNVPKQNAIYSPSAQSSRNMVKQPTNSKAINQASTTQAQKNIQLNTNDLAIWTDQYGIIHHVDSNGLDHQTIPGSVQAHYENWSGKLPANTQVTPNAGPNIPTQSDKVQHNNGIQLGLGDVATWTDQYGINHNVDSDGMDRQTIPGSTEVHYQDWSGALPTNAQVIHNN